MTKVRTLLITLFISANFCFSQKSSIVVNYTPFGQSGYFVCRGIDVQYRYQKDQYFGSVETGMTNSFKSIFDDDFLKLDNNIFRSRVSDIHTSYYLPWGIDSVNVTNTKGEAIKLLKGGLSSQSQEFISFHFGILKNIKGSKWSWSAALGPRIGITRSTNYGETKTYKTDIFNPYVEIRQIHEKFIFLKANVQSGINYNFKDNLAIGARFSYARPLNNFFGFHFHDFFFSASLAVKI